MPGRSTAPATGTALEAAVADLAEGLRLDVRRKVRVGRRLWGSIRHIDVVATDPRSRKTLGIECKYQGAKGTAEEKLPALINDISAWPIPPKPCRRRWRWCPGYPAGIPRNRCPWWRR